MPVCGDRDGPTRRRRPGSVSRNDAQATLRVDHGTHVCVGVDHRMFRVHRVLVGGTDHYHARTCSLGRLDADGCILEHQAVLHVDAQAESGELEAVGRGLAALHVLGGDEHGRQRPSGGGPTHARPR